MDILDIDEIEDDFGIFEEKIQDDVTNILKQWKIGNNKKDAVFDSRTFTRPKGSIIRHSMDGSQIKSPLIQDNQNYMGMKIGGLVSNIQKSFLNDISPPTSVCSSINFENETMSNSLITSADFSNISFFKTSLMDSNIDFAFKNNLKQYNNYDQDIRCKREKNIPQDFCTNDTTMKSSVSKDNQQFDNFEKFDAEENINLLTDSTKENSPNCHQVDNNGSSFQNNTQIISNTFKKRNSIILNDNSTSITKTSELDERPTDINKTFLRKPKTDSQLNKTFDQTCVNNAPNEIKDQETTQKLNETLVLKRVEKNKTFDFDDSNFLENNIDFRNPALRLDEKLLNNFENTTSTPQKNIENELDKNVDFSPITPFNTCKLKKKPCDEKLSDNEDLFDISENFQTKSRTFDNCKIRSNNYKNDDLDFDNLSDISDKVENFKEDAMKKSLETIKKRYSHKFDKTHPITDKLNVQKIGSPISENGRLLSRRSRLNDDLILNYNIVNETENKINPSAKSNQKIENDLCSDNLKKSENKIVNETHVQINGSQETELLHDEKELNLKKKNDSKRTRNDDRFKTIKINKPFIEQYGEEILNVNETENFSPAFARIDKNIKISNFENEPLKYESKLNTKIRQYQLPINEKCFQEPLKNLKYERITKNENLGKAFSASNLENATKSEQNSSFKFTIPAPVKQIKSPMGTKAKSFHNLASNNFGFGFKKSTLQIASKVHDNTFSLTDNIKSSNNTKNNDSSSKTPLTSRSSNLKKKSGLLRPSSGYFSRGLSNEPNMLQATFIKDDKNTKEESNCSNILNFDSEPLKKDEVCTTTELKPSKLIRPIESKLPTNIKRSGLPRPSVYYRK